MILLDKKYDGENIVDATRDITESFDETFTHLVAHIPKDQYGFQTGTFRITVEWIPE